MVYCRFFFFYLHSFATIQIDDKSTFERRWDLAALDQLPDHLRACFKALYDITNEFAYKVQKKHGWNPIDSLVKSV